MGMMMKVLLFVAGMLAGFSGWSQMITMADVEKQFIEVYCRCLENYSIGLKPGQLLFDQSENCIRGYFRDHSAEFTQLLESDSVLAASDLSDYEKGRALGVRMIQGAIDDLVKDCSFYRQTLSEYKSIMISQVLQPQDSIDRVIDRIREKESIIQAVETKATFYSILGILHEYAGRKEEALMWYDKSLEAKVTTVARGLRTLLALEK